MRQRNVLLSECGNQPTWSLNEETLRSRVRPYSRPRHFGLLRAIGIRENSPVGAWLLRWRSGSTDTTAESDSRPASSSELEMMDHPGRQPVGVDGP